jgi:hypothetical protein
VGAVGEKPLQKKPNDYMKENAALGRKLKSNRPAGYSDEQQCDM